MKAVALLAVVIALFQGSFFVTLTGPARTAARAAQVQVVQQDGAAANHARRS